MSKKITTLIFDFDGTLANTFPVILRVASHLASDLGIKDFSNIDLDEIRKKSIKELIIQYKIPFYKIPLLVVKGQKMLKQYLKEIKCFPKIPLVLGQLKKKGYRLGILSSNSRENIEMFLKLNHLTDFDFIYSEKNLFGKHVSLIHLLNKHHLDKQEVLYIGDEVRDIEACKLVKVPVAAVTWGFNDRQILVQSQPDHIIDYPSQLLSIIN